MRTVGFITALVTIAGCTHQLPAPTQTPAQVENAALGCPLSQPVPIDANVMDVPDGVSITFTGPPRALDRIRANVFAMKEATASQGDPFAVCPCAISAAPRYGLAPPTYGESINQQAGAGPNYPYGNPTIDGRTLMQPIRTVPATASIDEIPEGAMLVLRPKDAAQLQSLRDSVRANVGAMEMACVNPR
jgi:hypothetical protein